MSKPRSYKLFPKAKIDIEEIWVYTFENWSMSQADNYYQMIVNGFESLADGSKQGRKVDHVRPGYFRLSVGSHYIFYKESLTDIYVVRVLHRNMDSDRHL